MVQWSIGRAGARNIRGLLLLLSVGWCPPDVPPSGAYLARGTRVSFRRFTPSRGAPPWGCAAADRRGTPAAVCIQGRVVCGTARGTGTCWAIAPIKPPKWSGGLEAREVAEFRYGGDGPGALDATPGLERFDERRSPPGCDQLVECLCETPQAFRVFGDRADRCWPDPSAARGWDTPPLHATGGGPGPREPRPCRAYRAGASRL